MTSMIKKLRGWLMDDPEVLDTASKLIREAADEIKRLQIERDASMAIAGKLYGQFEEADRLRKALAIVDDQAERAVSAVEQLTAERDALRQDAKRYRYMRDATTETELLVYSRGTDLDAAIDEAMEKK